jgi:hypothetical protein
MEKTYRFLKYVEQFASNAAHTLSVLLAPIFSRTVSSPLATAVSL